MKWHVSAAVHAGKFLGTFEAETGQKAIEKAMRRNGDVSVCHHCDSEVSDPELGAITATSEDGQEVVEGAEPTWQEQARAAGWTPPEEKRASRARKAAR